MIISPIQRIVALNLREARQESGISQKVLAEAIDRKLSENLIYKYENCTVRVPIDTGFEMAEVMGVSFARLFRMPTDPAMLAHFAKNPTTLQLDALTRFLKTVKE